MKFTEWNYVMCYVVCTYDPTSNLHYTTIGFPVMFCDVILFSSHCMTEFDLAYHHNVASKRKKRLIVLMMLDNPATDLYNDDASDKAALRQYVRQYTYIDYRKDYWLDRLLYALPLRGLLQQQNHGDEMTLLDGIQ